MFISQNPGYRCELLGIPAFFKNIYAKWIAYCCLDRITDTICSYGRSKWRNMGAVNVKVSCRTYRSNSVVKVLGAPLLPYAMAVRAFTASAVLSEYIARSTACSIVFILYTPRIFQISRLNPRAHNSNRTEAARVSYSVAGILTFSFISPRHLPRRLITLDAPWWISL